MPTRWMNRGRANAYCGACGKTAFPSEAAAKLAVARMDDNQTGFMIRSTYRCPKRRTWWHVSKKSKSQKTKQGSH